MSSRSAQQWLASLRTAHSLADATMLYPVQTLPREKGNATMAYAEQRATRVQSAALEDIGHDYMPEKRQAIELLAREVCQSAPADP